MQRRQEILQDVTDAVGSAFMGLTVGCAKCHDHKFDPILHRDYYRLQAFFANTANDDRIPVWSPKQRAEEQRKSEEWTRTTAEIREEIAGLLKEARQAVIDEEYFKFPDEIKNAVAKAPEQRSPYEQQLAHRAKVISEPSLFLTVPKLKGEKKKRYEELKAELAKFDNLYHARRADRGRHARPRSARRPRRTFWPWAITRGRSKKSNRVSHHPRSGPGEDHAACQRSIDRPADRPGEMADRSRKSADRPCRWSTASGIITSAPGSSPPPATSDAWAQRPTHPELLDWLSAEFVRNGWSLKRMHRLMVTSSAYRQSLGSIGRTPQSSTR